MKVLRRVAAGKSNKVIAAELVKTHDILAKLDVRDGTDAVMILL